MPELSLPASAERLDVAVLGHRQGVVVAGGGRDETLSVGFDAHLMSVLFVGSVVCYCREFKHPTY